MRKINGVFLRLEGLANWRGEKAAIGRAENVDYINHLPRCRPHNSGQPGKKQRTPFAARITAAVGQRTKDLLGQETLLLSQFRVGVVGVIADPRTSMVPTSS